MPYMQKTKSERLICCDRKCDADEVLTFDPYEDKVLTLDMKKMKSERLICCASKCDVDEVLISDQYEGEV